MQIYIRFTSCSVENLILSRTAKNIWIEAVSRSSRVQGLDYRSSMKTGKNKKKVIKKNKNVIDPMHPIWGSNPRPWDKYHAPPTVLAGQLPESSPENLH